MEFLSREKVKREAERRGRGGSVALVRSQILSYFLSVAIIIAGTGPRRSVGKTEALPMAKE